MGCYDIIYCIVLPLRSASFSFLQTFQPERLLVYPIGMVIELVVYSVPMRVEWFRLKLEKRKLIVSQR